MAFTKKLQRRTKENSLPLSALGLFSGCGGMDFGASLANFHLVGAYDNDPIAIKTYQRNVSKNAFLCDLSKPDLSHLPRDVSLLLGGPPCQGFSSAGLKDPTDSRNLLWKTYLRVLKHIRPKAFILENVTGFLTELEDFSIALIKDLKGEYVFEHKKINTQFYGVPQHRIRLFIVGIHRDLSNSIPWPKPLLPEVSNQNKKRGWTIVPGMISMEMALANLGPAVTVSNPKKETWGNPHEYLALEPSHAAIASFIPNGGSLRSIPDLYLPENYQGRERTRRGWPWFYRKPNPLLPGRTVTASLRPIYSTVLAPDAIPTKAGNCWTWKVVDPAQYTKKSGLYTSPIAPRRLTVLECSRLQTFPDDFEFFGTYQDKIRQIGNAVPVEFSRQLCLSIAAVL